MQREKFARLVLRLGLAFAFLYASIAGFLDPASWTGFFPDWLTGLVPLAPEMLLLAFGIGEVILASLILFLPRPFVPALIAVALLVTMVVSNLPQLDILFRDISLAAGALALAFLSR